jgi:filamentous hemagglutinin family protein
MDIKDLGIMAMLSNVHDRRPSSFPIRRHVARAALLLATTALTSPVFVGLASAQSLPTGGSVAAGSVTIAQPSATRLNITQSSQSAIVNWQGFSIGQGSSVNISQPNASSAILNRVTGSTPSTIAGQLTANGQVYLVNPNGIAITKSGTVDVGGGFVASTLGISDDDFMSGNRTFTGNGASARVSNAGVITVGRGGYAALLGGTVSNSGLINVPLGQVGLGSGEQATLDFAGDGFLQVAMPTAAGGKGALIKNSGSIIANGGSVIITAATAREAARNAINISGLVQARSIGGHSGSIMIGGGAGGRIRISGRLIATSRHHAGGSIAVTGQNITLAGATIDASGATGGGTIDIGGDSHGSGPLLDADTVTIDAATTIRADATQSGNGGNVVVWSDGATSVHGLITAMGGPGGGNGGSIETSGHQLSIAGVRVNAGIGGAWLLDPFDLTINAAAYSAIDLALGAGTNVTLLTSATGTQGPGTANAAGSGDIILTNQGTIDWTTDATLTLSAYRNITFDSGASITHTGTGGSLVLRADNTGTGTGTVNFASAGQVSFSGGGTVSIFYNPTGDSTSVNATKYTSATQTNFSTNVNTSGGATLTTSMLVNTVYDLQNIQNDLGGAYALGRDIDASATSTWNPNGSGGYYGFVPIGNGAAQFTGVLDGQGHVVNGLTIDRPVTDYVGLIGYMSGSGALLSNIGMVGGSITGQNYVGGLVGYNDLGTVQNSYATGDVSANGHFIGGLVGVSQAGTIETSYATGTVSGGANSFDIGGLVGENEFGTVETSYATGAVSGPSDVGGLVGLNFAATVQTSYATGAVSGGTGSSDLGGLVGANSIVGTVETSFATGAVSGSCDVGGLVGSNSFLVQNSYATGAVSGSNNLGGLVGYNESTVRTSYATGNVSGGEGSQSLGGLVGYNQSASAIVQNSYATGAVTGGVNSGFIGGLVGANIGGTVETSYATGAVTGGIKNDNLQDDFIGGLVGINNGGGTVETSYATGAVTGGGGDGGLLVGFLGGFGGLVGYNGGTVQDSYATGAVSGGAGSQNIGGLVGINNGGTVLTSYATGAVSGGTGSSNLGGLVGANYGTISNSYFDTQTTGLSLGIGFDNNNQSANVIGLTTADFQLGVANAGLGAAFAGGTIVVGGAGGGVGGLYPYLKYFFPNGVQVISGFAYTDGGATPLAGPNTVSAIVNGEAFGSATTGANGYYYVFGAAGSIASGNSVLVYTSANATGSTNAATLATATGASNQSSDNIYGNAVTVPTTAATLSAAPTLGSAQNSAESADGGNTAVSNIIEAITGIGLISSASSFTINQAVTTSSTFVVQTPSGAPITVAAPITIGGSGGLGLLSGGALTIDAQVNVTAAGSVNLAAVAQPGVTTTGLTFGNGASIDYGAADKGGTFVLNGQSYKLVYTMAELDAIDGTEAVGGTAVATYGPGLAGDYALATNLNATGTTYHESIIAGARSPLASPTPFTGMLDGLGHTITGLTIAASGIVSGTAYVGLIGKLSSTLFVNKLSGTVSNIGLVGESIAGQEYVGGLVGDNAFGTVQTSYTTGAVSGGGYVGGLVGWNDGGPVQSSYATGAVSGSMNVGGLVGDSVSGIVQNSYATGAVSGITNVGGLVGQNQTGTVETSYATGAVSGGANSTNLGGLVGYNQAGTVETSYAIGAVSGGAGSSNLGGLVGLNDVSGVVQESFFDTQTTGLSRGIGTDNNDQGNGVIGLTTRQLQGLDPLPGNASPPVYFSTLANFGSSAFAGGTGGLFPYLTYFFPNGVQAISGFAYTNGGQTLLTSPSGIVNGTVPAAGYVSAAANGTSLGNVTTGANGYYYILVPNGTLPTGTGVVAYTQTDTSANPSGAQNGASFTQSNGGSTVANLNVYGGWRLDQAGSGIASLSALNAAYATAVGGTAPSGFTLANREIDISATAFSIDQTLSLTGTLALSSTGGVTQSGSISAANLLLSGAGGSFTLTNAGNQIGTLAANTGSVTLDDSTSLAIGAVSNASAAKTSGVTTVGQVKITTTGNLTISAGARISGASPLLAASGAFVNNEGSDAVTATSGSWLIYSNNPAGDTFGNLNSGNTAVWNTTAVAAVTQTGDRYAFALQPTLTVTTISDSKIYGVDATSQVAGDYTTAITGPTGFENGVAGAYLADSAATALTGTPIVASVGSGAAANVAGSPYAITASAVASSGYKLVFDNAGTLTVTPRGLTITANAESNTYGNVNPALIYTVGSTTTTQGLVNGDTLTGLLATAANATSGVGSYAITQGTLAASSNYAVTYVGANLTITPRPLTITADAKSNTYGNAEPALTYTLGGQGLVNNDTLTGGLATVANATSGVGSYAITQSNLAASANYAVTYVGANLTITPRPLTITADAKSNIYGDADPALTYTLGGQGLVNNDTLSGGLATVANATSGVGTYAITQGNLAASTNYAVTYVGANLTINPRGLIVTADPQSRLVGDPNPPLTYVIGGLGLVNGDTLSGGLATEATTQSGAGSYAITQGNLAASANYAVSYVGANLTVTPVASNTNQANNNTNQTNNNAIINPLVVAGVSYQPPKATSINFVTTQGTPGPLIAFTGSASNTRTATGPGASKPTAANPDDITGAIGNALAPSADGLIYRPISQYDAAQYSGGKIPDHADQAGLATILTMIARAIGHDNVPAIDQLFDATKGADWHGVGWQNPYADKVTFSSGSQPSEPSAATALALDGNTDLGALLGHGPVILAGSGDNSWLLAVALIGQGIVANDPVTGMRVLLGYNAATKAIGAVSKIFDPAGNTWIALGDAAKAGIASVDPTKIAALQTFTAAKYLTVTQVK